MAKRRRSNGDGAVYQTKDRTWRATVGLNWANGTRQRKYLSGPTKAAVSRSARDDIPATEERAARNTPEDAVEASAVRPDKAPRARPESRSDDGELDAIAQAGRMQRAAQRQLRLLVASALLPHGKPVARQSGPSAGRAAGVRSGV